MTAGDVSSRRGQADEAGGDRGEPGDGDCGLCGGRTEPALEAREMMLGTRERFAYHRCRDCGSLVLARPPADPERFYGDAYYASHAAGRGSGRGPGLRRLRRAISARRLRDDAVARAIPGRRFGRFAWLRRTGTGLDDPILDVGCGNGRLLGHLATAGFSNLTGIDPRWSGPERTGRGLRFRRETPEAHDGAYRLVMAHHSWEHMSAPAASLRAMARLVAPSGHLLLRVPLADGWAARHYGADWVQLDAPRHRFLPTREAVGRLARAAGLEVARIEDDSGPFQIWGSELYRRDVALVEAGPGGRGVLSLAERLAARWRAAALRRAGQGDQACFYLLRPDPSTGPT